jgi:hypothetical protein
LARVGTEAREGDELLVTLARLEQHAVIVLT